MPASDSIRQRFKELAFEYHPDVSQNKNPGPFLSRIYEASALIF